MSRKQPKYLIDTSAVRAAVRRTSDSQADCFQEETQDGSQSTSIYIRMEFIRLWICTFIRAAHFVDLYDDFRQAIYRLEQDFKQRRIKADLAFIAELLGPGKVDSDSQAAAEEIGRIAVMWLWEFDDIFNSRTQNTCRCEIGGKSLEVDFNYLLSDLQEFYTSFMRPVTDCQINKFLQFDKPKGRAGLLVSDARVVKLKVVANLMKYYDTKRWLTCKECVKIGDAVIALEQPKAYTLICTDKSFDTLCQVTGRKHKCIPSLVALDKEEYPEPS